MNDSQWPEEEATATYRQWKYLADVDGMEYADNWLSKQKRHMYDVLEEREYCMRYDAALARLFSGE
jgi:hypothetical protein